MGTTTAFEEEVLGRVADDYEAAHTLASDISRDLDRTVSEAEVRQALLSLATAGRVTAYLYDEAAQKYRGIGAGQAQAESEVWFMATRGAH